MIHRRRIGSPRPRAAAFLAAPILLMSLALSASAQLRVVDPFMSPGVGDILFESVPKIEIGLKEGLSPSLNGDRAALFSMEGPMLEGYTADGVTVLLIGYRAPEPGCVEFIVTDNNSGTEPAPADSVGVMRNFFVKNHVGNPLLVDTKLITAFDLPPAGSGGSPKLLQEHWAFAELRAPQDFARSPADFESQSRLVGIEATFQKKEDCGTVYNHVADNIQLTLYRPPVVLAHGIWSSGATWHKETWSAFLDTSGPFGDGSIAVDYNKKGVKPWVSFLPWGLPLPHWYEDEAARSFDKNRYVVPNAIDKAVLERRKRKIATTQVDVVCHSMGGLLSRIFVQGMNPTDPSSVVPYRTKWNWHRGVIHKLITIGTPHYGTPWGDAIIEFANPLSPPIGLANASKRAHLANFFSDLIGKPLFQGAVADMRTDSDEIAQLLAAEVPSHALVSTGGKAALESVIPEAKWIWDAGFFWVDIVHYLTTSLSAFINGPSMFNGDEHDLLVPAVSQRGGLDSSNSTTLAAPTWQMTHAAFGNIPALCGGSSPCWVGETASPIWADRVKTLLNAKILPGGAFAPKFPKPPSGIQQPGTPQGGDEQPGSGFEVNGVQLLVPGPGSILEGGQSLELVAAPVAGFPIEWAGFAYPGGFEVGVHDVTTDTWRADIVVPDEWLGSHTIGVAASATYGAVAKDSVVAEVVLPSGVFLTGIECEPGELGIWNSPFETSLTVTGQFSDGVSRDLSSGSLGTQYVVADSTIVEVTSSGKVSGLALGQTSVQVSNSGVFVDVPVVVHEIRGDVDGDGVIQLVDFGGFASCYSGGEGSPGYASPDVACLSTFDFDADLDIDGEDYLAFLQVYTGPAFPDCNVDGVNDMDAILAGLSIDCDQDGVPDECGVDCNGNGMADACDVRPENFGFDEGVSYTTASIVPPGDVVTGDFDGDGLLDMAAAHPGSGLSVWIAIRAGEFGEYAVANGGMPQGTSPVAMRAGDLDSDGRADLVVCADHPGNSTSDKLVIYSQGQANGVFASVKFKGLTSTSSQFTGPRDVILTDLNGDGLRDISVAKGTLESVSPGFGEVDVMLNTSAGGLLSFSAPADYPAQNGARALVSASFDADGDRDLAIACWSTATGAEVDSVAVLWNTGNGTFSGGPRDVLNASSGFEFHGPVTINAADLTGDKRPDLAVANALGGSIDVIANVYNFTPAAPFEHVPGVGWASDPRDLVMGDMDGDTRVDMVVADAGQSTVSVLLNECFACAYWGAGSGASQLPVGSLSPQAAVATGDMDSDGRADLVIAELGNKVSVLKNHTIFPFSADRDGNGIPDECDDCNGNTKLDSCEIQLGLLPDCNGNFVSDVCEPLGPLNDCDNNGKIDECEVASGSGSDCDGDGLLDSCAIAQGLAADCNLNGVPDSCDIGSLFSATSPKLMPLDKNVTQSWTFSGNPDAPPGVLVTVRIEANLNVAGGSEGVIVVIFDATEGNPLNLGKVFNVGYGCDGEFPDKAELTLTADQFNARNSIGGVLVRLYPTPGIEPTCLNSWAKITLKYSNAVSLDQNGNGIPDECPGG